MNPSGKLLREIRQAARDCHKREIHASMQAVAPRRVLAVDANYRGTKKTSSNSSATCTLLAKDGPDKGNILAYPVRSEGESHNKSPRSCTKVLLYVLDIVQKCVSVIFAVAVACLRAWMTTSSSRR